MNICEIHHIGALATERILDPSTVPTVAAEGGVWAGLWGAQVGFRFRRQCPGVGQVLVALGGRGRVWVDQGWRDCGPGQAYLTPPGQPHDYEALGVWDVAWVMLSSSTWPASVDRPKLVDLDTLPIRSVLEEIHREVLGSADRETLTHWSRLLRCLATRACGPVQGDPRLLRLLGVVSTRLSDPWTLETMAASLHMSPEHLRRLAQRHWGCSPVRRLTRLRMEQAASLLAHRSSKVATVAAEVGYENPFAFSVAYRRHFGVAPRSDRANGRKRVDR